MGSSQPLGSLKIKTVASLSREIWAITPTSLLRKNLTYSSIFKVYFKKSFATAKASLVFIKSRYRSSRSQMFFKIGVLKNFAMFTGKHLCWSLFLIKLQAFRCFSVNIAKLLKAVFYKTPPLAAPANVLFGIIFSKRCCWIYCSFTLHNCFILKPKITFICFHSLRYLLSFVIPLVVTCFATRCRSLYYWLSLAVIRCRSLYHSLPLVVTWCTTRLSFCKRS